MTNGVFCRDMNLDLQLTVPTKWHKNEGRAYIF